MPIPTGFSDLSNLYGVPYGKFLTLIVADLGVVDPAFSTQRGLEQSITLVDQRGGRIAVKLYQQKGEIPQSGVGQIIRISARPSDKRGIVWEHSKAVGPNIKIGTLVVRERGRVEVLTAAQASTLGVQARGFVLDDTVELGRPGELPLAQAPSSVPVRSSPAPAVSLPEAGPQEQTALKVAQCFRECLEAAKTVLGPEASAADIQATARATFEQMMSRRPAA